MKKYFVCYNAKFIAERKTLKGCQDFISRKGLKDDENNLLYIVDDEGEEYPLIKELKK